MIPSCATDKVSLKELTGVAKTAVLRLLSPSAGSSTSAISANKLSMAAAMMLNCVSLAPPLFEGKQRRVQYACAVRGGCCTSMMEIQKVDCHCVQYEKLTISRQNFLLIPNHLVFLLGCIKLG